jgi:hypothetical protein
MPLEKPERALQTLICSNGKDNEIELATDNAYSQLVLRLTLNLTNGGVSPTFTEDDILNYWKAIRLLRNGKNVKYNKPARVMFHEQTIEKRTKPYKKDPVTTVSSTYDAIVTLDIDFRQDRLNEADITALLQTANLSSLKLIVQTGIAADIASANAPTINSAKVEIEAVEVSGTVTTKDGEKDINDDKQIKLLDIIEDTQEIALLANKTSYDSNTQEIDITPAGTFILTHGMMVTDNGLKSNSLITDFKVQRVKGGKKDIIQRSWNSKHERVKSEYQQESLVPGILIQDWQEKLGGLGFDNTAVKGTYLWRLLTSSGVDPTQDKVTIFTRYA